LTAEKKRRSTDGKDLPTEQTFLNVFIAYWEKKRIVEIMGGGIGGGGRSRKLKTREWKGGMDGGL